MAKGKGGAKWTPARRRKFMATVKAKTKLRELGDAVPARAHRGVKVVQQRMSEQISDARVYLVHAVNDIYDRMRSGRLKKPDKAHLMAMLALSELDG